MCGKILNSVFIPITRLFKGEQPRSLSTRLLRVSIISNQPKYPVGKGLYGFAVSTVRLSVRRRGRDRFNGFGPLGFLSPSYREPHFGRPWRGLSRAAHYKPAEGFQVKLRGFLEPVFWEKLKGKWTVLDPANEALRQTVPGCSD